MQFELTRDFIDTLTGLIEREEEITLKKMLEELHPADLAEIYRALDIEQDKYLHLLLDQEKATDVLVELEENERRTFLKVLPGEVIAKQYIENMDSDDAADLIGELEEEKKDEVLLNLKDDEKAGYILDLLNYEEDTAGGLMAKELITVNENWSIGKCLGEMRRQAEDLDEIYYVYVVDNRNILKGTVSLKKMLLNPDDTLIKDIYEEDVISVKANTQDEEVGNIMKKYDLVALPVTDPVGRLLGRITIDDVVDVIREEADRDYQMVSGINPDVGPSSNVFVLTKARFPWLLIGLIGGIFGAQVIGLFEGDIGLYPEMAFYIPLIGAMGGNVGVQSSSIIVQSIANKSIGLERTISRLVKEFMIALLNALVLSSLIFVYNLIFIESMALTVTVSSALFSVILFASIFGTIVPLALDKFNIDPALATGPFITTINDIMGLLIYLSVGRTLYSIM
jgi:magnesium transporter